MPWFRLYSEFATDPKVQSMTEAMQRRFVILMCLRCNEDLEKLSDDEIAFALRISLDELDKTKTALTEKGFLADGWKIRAWDKRQYRSDDSKERAKRYRERQKAVSVTASSRSRHGVVTVQDTDTDTDTEAEESKSKPLVRTDDEKQPDDYQTKTAEAFEKVFWCRYPRKDKKKDALKAFRSVFPRRQAKKTAKVRWDNLQLHLDKSLQEFAQRDPSFIPLPASWLRGQDFDAPPEADLHLIGGEVWIPDD